MHVARQSYAQNERALSFAQSIANRADDSDAPNRPISSFARYLKEQFGLEYKMLDQNSSPQSPIVIRQGSEPKWFERVMHDLGCAAIGVRVPELDDDFVTHSSAIRGQRLS